ncbi:hypothetical protein BDD12DRAFT_831920 [Trichophaea hybrida]|nr:hypothetical protein BDD12DRAFT_831920 [Trichophaea hybrida]
MIITNTYNNKDFYRRNQGPLITVFRYITVKVVTTWIVTSNSSRNSDSTNLKIENLSIKTYSISNEIHAIQKQITTLQAMIDKIMTKSFQKWREECIKAGGCKECKWALFTYVSLVGFHYEFNFFVVSLGIRI